MANFKVGTLTVPAATGTQAVTGVGFTPKVVIFFSSGIDTAGGTWEGTINEFFGFAAGTVGGDHAVIGVYSQDAVADSNTARRESNGQCIAFADQTGAVTGYAHMNSFDSDGFTLNWTVISSPAPGKELFYLAIGGSEISAKVLTWTSPTTATSKSVTGAGFQPDLVIHLSAGSNTAPPFSTVHANLGIGVMDKNGGQWSNSWDHIDALATSDTYRHQRTDRCLMTAFGGAAVIEAHYTSMDTDGFTVTFDVANVGGNPRYVFSLCLKGLTTKVGSFNTAQLTTATTQAVTGTGFQPAGILFSTFGGGATTAISSQGIHSVGASDGTSDFGHGVVDEDALTTMNADRVGFTTRSLVIPTTGPSTYAKGKVNSFDSNGFTVGWDAATGTVAFEMLYLAMKSSQLTLTDPALTDADTLSTDVFLRALTDPALADADTLSTDVLNLVKILTDLALTDPDVLGTDVFSRTPITDPALVDSDVLGTDVFSNDVNPNPWWVWRFVRQGGDLYLVPTKGNSPSYWRGGDVVSEKIRYTTLLQPHAMAAVAAAWAANSGAPTATLKAAIDAALSTAGYRDEGGDPL